MNRWPAWRSAEPSCTDNSVPPGISGAARSRRTTVADKANCACAQLDHPGHGPRYLWTRSVSGGTTKGRQLSGVEVEKVRQELANNEEFVALSEQIVEVNEAICEARPRSRLAADEHEQHPEAEKEGSSATSKRSSRPR